MRIVYVSLMFCLLGATPLWAWEFNTDGDKENFSHSGEARFTLSVANGILTATVDPNGTGAAMGIWAPGGFVTDPVTGILMKMRSSVDPQGATGSVSFINAEDGQTAPASYEIPYDAEDPDAWHLVFVDLFGTNRPEEFTGDIAQWRLNLPSIGTTEVYNVEIDFIHLEGQLIDNEGFEYLDDWKEDEGWGWAIRQGDAENFSNEEQEHVFGRDWALAVTGTGSYQALKQTIKGGMDLEKGSTVTLYGAVKVPTDAWEAGSHLWLRVTEKSSGNESHSAPVEVTAFDEWLEFTSAVELSGEPSDRDFLEIHLYSKTKAGSTIYIDELFVDVQPPVEESLEGKIAGWPIPCVKVAEGQAAPVADGVIEPNEYAGAKPIVINQVTTNLFVDPYDPNYYHKSKENSPGQWAATPLEDYNATFYFMWDEGEPNDPNDGYLYMAISVKDDHVKFQATGNPAGGDAIQMTIAQTVNESRQNQMYIPGWSIADANGLVHSKNDFGGWIEFDIMQYAEHGGSYDADTQDYVIEMRMPWWAMIGDFDGDLVNGDADGNGRNVFPPQVSDVLGVHIISVDRDPAFELFSSIDPDDFPWADNSHQPFIFEDAP